MCLIQHPLSRTAFHFVSMSHPFRIARLSQFVLGKFRYSLKCFAKKVSGLFFSNDSLIRPKINPRLTVKVTKRGTKIGIDGSHKKKDVPQVSTHKNSPPFFPFFLVDPFFLFLFRSFSLSPFTPSPSSCTS